MKTKYKVLVIFFSLALMLFADVPVQIETIVPPLFDQIVPEAQAIFGVRRRTRRRTAVIVGSAAYAEGVAAHQQATAAQQEAATVKQQPAATTPPPPPAAAAGKPLPLGTVVTTLPSGCTPTPVGGVEYYYCSGNFYRAAFQGNQLIYVTAKPE
jgi:hypothetical protein